MDTKKLKRNIFLSLIVILITAGNYSRLLGTENIRPIHELTLLVMGMGLGVLIVNLRLYFKFKNNK